MNRSLLLSTIFFIFYCSCSRLPAIEQDLKESLNKPLHLSVSDIIHKGGDILSYNDLRQKHEYLSVVYLEDGCQPCIPKFIEWQHKMDSIGRPENYSILFVLQSDSYETFMINVLNTNHIIDKYYTIIDSKYDFLTKNSSIPRWIIDASVLIDAENKI